MTTQTSSPVLFEAVIVPHRSLGKRGLRRLMGALFALSGLVAIGLWIAGAWPVIGFTGLEAALAVWLLRRHASIDGHSEVLLLSDDGLRIIRSARGSRSELSVPTGWLRSTLEERPGRAPALMLRGSGVTIEVAMSLGEAEKRDLAISLSDALARQRNPVFDNPQLRESPAAVSPRSDPST